MAGELERCQSSLRVNRTATDSSLWWVTGTKSDSVEARNVVLRVRWSTRRGRKTERQREREGERRESEVWSKSTVGHHVVGRSGPTEQNLGAV